MTISAGTTTQVDPSASVDGYDSARISDTQMLVAYLDTPGTLGARVLGINISTKAITVNAQSSIAHGTQLREISLVRFSSTKFLFVTEVGRTRVLNVSGTTVTGGPITALADNPNFGASRLIPITSTTALWVYSLGGDWYARVLSIDGSDNVFESARLTIAVDTISAIDVAGIALYTSSKAIFVFQDDDSSNFYLRGQLINISGTTITLDGSKQALYTAKQGWNSSCAVAELSFNEVVTAHNIDVGGATEGLACHVVTLSGSTLSTGATLELAASEFIEPFQGIAANNTTILFNGGTSATSRVTQVIKDGTTLSHTTSDFIDISVNTRIILDSMKKIADDYVLVCTLGSADGTVVGSNAVIPPPPATGPHTWLYRTEDGGLTWSPSRVKTTEFGYFTGEI